MAENYLKLKLQSDRQLSIWLTRSIREMHEGHMDTIEKVKAGGQRLINYGSCIIPNAYYRGICLEQWREDKRLVLGFSEMYKRNDIVLDMVELYFRKTLRRLGPEKSANLSSIISDKIGYAAHLATNKASKISLSFTIARLLINSEGFKKIHFKIVDTISSWFVNGLTVYSKAQTASLAVNKLKYQDPEYYQILYKEKIEMMYFLIEPYMSQVIYQIESGGNNEEIIGDALYEMLKR